MQRLDTGSGQPSVPQTTSDLTAELRSQVREPAPDRASDQEFQGVWIALLGLAVAIGVVLLAVFAGISRPDKGVLAVGRLGQKSSSKGKYPATTVGESPC